MTTLLDYANDQLQDSAKETARTQADLARAQQDQTKAQADAAAAATDVASLQTEASQLRQKIAAATTVADGQALFLQLEKNTIDTRSAQLRLAHAQERLADAQSRIAGTSDEIDRTASMQKAARAEKDLVQGRDADHIAWSSAAGTLPLSTLPAQAKVSTAGPAKDAADAAKKRLTGATGDIPQALFDRAEDRWAAEVKRLDDLRKAAEAAEDALATELAKDGFSGTSEQARVAYERAERDLRYYALTAQERYDRAIALLTSVADATRAKLTTDEKQRIADLAQAIDDLKTRAANPVDVIQLQKDRDDAQVALDDAYTSLATAYLKSIAADPAVDPETTPDVTTARTAIGTATTDLATAQTAYDAAKEDLERFEASVPDATWQLLADYEEAIALLANLEAAKPGDLVTALTNAENAYATALSNQRDNERKVVALGDVARERDDHWQNAARNRTTRLLGALRGDE
jgi:DNA replication initiation complex subunit (GINS family)